MKIIGMSFWDRYALLQFSRGCPYNCIFCLKKMYGPGYRRKDPEKFIQEIDYVVNEIGARSVYFYDLTFTAHKPSVYRICDIISQRGYKFDWCCQTRVEMTDPDLLSAMKSAGCKLIHLGVESGSDRISKTLEKQVNLEQIREGSESPKTRGSQQPAFSCSVFQGRQLKI